MSTAYGAGSRRTGHPPREQRPFRDVDVGLLAAAAVLAVWVGASGRASVLLPVFVGASAAGAVVARRHGRGAGVLVLGVIAAAAALSAHEWRTAVPRELGPFATWVTLRTDPVAVGRGTAMVVEVSGERFQVHAHGSPGRRLSALQAGDVVWIEGVRAELTGRHRRRAMVRHVVGQVEVRLVGDRATSTPLARASNRVRELLRRGADRAMPAGEAALFTGLVVGDDARQPRSLVDDFRTAGLSHLTAVSGQNVAFTLALAGVVLRRLATWWRLTATIGIIAWFAIMTRLEPSVLRAATMAALGAVSFAVGRERSPPRLLATAVVVLVLVDPFLVWSIGFWLSTGATAGVTVIAPRVEPRLGGPSWLAPAISVTIGAQVGVLVPSGLVFGRLPALGLVANLLAVPVAGIVMLIGIPAAIVAAVAPPALASVIMAPSAVGTRWIAVVARLAARLEPVGAAAVAVWAAQVVVLVALVVVSRRSTRTMP